MARRPYVAGSSGPEGAVQDLAPVHVDGEEIVLLLQEEVDQVGVARVQEREHGISMAIPLLL